MKKKGVIVLLIIMLLFPTAVLAQPENSDGTGNVYSSEDPGSPQNGDSACPLFTWEVPELDNQKSADNYYRVDLVYVPQGNNQKPKILQTAITNGGHSSFLTMLNNYKKNVEDSQDVEPFIVDNGPIMELVENFGTKGEKDINSTFHIQNQDERNKIVEKILITNHEEGGFGMKLKNMKEDVNIDHPDNEYGKSTANSYGYRIIIQKLVWFAHGCTTPSDNFIFGTRKEIASGMVSGFASNRSNNPVNLAKGKTTNGLTLSGKVAQLISAKGGGEPEYVTDVADMGIAIGTSSCACTGTSTKAGVSCQGDYVTAPCYNKFKDWKDGTGFQIIWWDHESLIDKYDYSLDMACTNCSSKIPDSKAMVIQDTTNWKAIEASKDVGDDECKSKLKEHFYHQNGKVYCREEYHVYFPNENNKIKVQLGRYFTLNADNDKLKSIEDGAIPNFAPIKVIKYRTCKGDETQLNKFMDKSIAQFSKCGGVIKVNYKEKNYELKDTSLVGTLDSDGTVNEIKDGTLRQKAIFNYTLADNIYKYIKIQDGSSVLGKPGDADLSKYRNVGISNLPVSMGATVSSASNNKIADLTFEYALPNANNSCTDKYSKFSDAYKKDNDYFSCANKKAVDNVYKKYKNGKNDNDEKIEDSACVKLYGSSGLNDAESSVRKCINRRTTNKMGNRGTSKNYNCFDKNNSNNYSCMIAADVCSKDTAGKVDPYKDMAWDENTNKCVKKCSHVGDKYYGPDGKEIDRDNYENKCCTKDTYEEMGRVWDEKNNKCCPSGSVWSEASGKCCSPEDYDPETKMCGGKPKISCSIDTYKDDGRDWNENEGVCCPEGQKYDNNTKKCEFPPTDKCAELQCGKNDKPCCVDCHRKAYCGNGSVKNGTDYCPGKPCIASSCTTDDCDIMKEVAAYRVIDPTNPFVSQSGTERLTGDNWCNNPASGSKYSCAGNSINKVVDQVISNKINVSEDDAMYKVELDQKTIDKIRAYNNANDYDDFNFTCYDNGACKSDFLKGAQLQGAISGKCYGSGKDSFYTCGK